MSSQDDIAVDMEAVRRAWRDANVVPLWETGVHRPDTGPRRGRIWRWQVLRSLIEQAVAVTSTETAERRVLALADPDAVGGRRTVGNLNVNLQILMPGESARPHRHTPSALRFVLEGEGGVTIVDGKPCPMETGDLVLTPSWSWHEHRHEGSGPLIWLDALDVPLHQYLGTAVFEPGPANKLPPVAPDGAYQSPGMTPVEPWTPRRYSPIFRYPRPAWESALAAAPQAEDGARRLRFSNPRDGGPALPLVETGMISLERGRPTCATRSNASSAALVVSGEGRSRIGEDVFEWSKNDILTTPSGNWVAHECTSDAAVLFVISDTDVLRRLDLLKEESAGSTL